MRDFFKLLDICEREGIYFCVQCSKDYYNFAVDDAYGHRSYHHSMTLDQLEEKFKLIWGHLLTGEKPKFIKKRPPKVIKTPKKPVAAPKKPAMPMPSFPMP